MLHRIIIALLASASLIISAPTRIAEPTGSSGSTQKEKPEVTSARGGLRTRAVAVRPSRRTSLRPIQRFTGGEENKESQGNCST
jgi:hypothetical protein